MSLYLVESQYFVTQVGIFSEKAGIVMNNNYNLPKMTLFGIGMFFFESQLPHNISAQYFCEFFVSSDFCHHIDVIDYN